MTIEEIKGSGDNYIYLILQNIGRGPRETPWLHSIEHRCKNAHK
jgi:hypothetical protein